VIRGVQPGSDLRHAQATAAKSLHSRHEVHPRQRHPLTPARQLNRDVIHVLGIGLNLTRQASLNGESLIVTNRQLPARAARHSPDQEVDAGRMFTAVTRRHVSERVLSAKPASAWGVGLLRVGHDLAPIILVLRFFVAQLGCALRYWSSSCCASLLRYRLLVIDPREELTAATRRYKRTEAAHKEARLLTVAAVVSALRAGVPPSEVERLSPFTAAYIRKLAREEDIPPAAPGPKRAHGIER
jgi:hypothetical protein